MPNTSKTILFFGTEDFSATALQALIDNRSALNITVGAVITKPDSKKTRGRGLSAPRVKTIALEHDIPVWQPARMSDIADDIVALQPAAGVLVSYGKIIPQSIIDLFSPGIINIHPSLLPLYRGPSPIESAILNGDQTTGVTLMQLSAAMDAGPLYTQHEVPLDGTETQDSLYDSLATIGAEQLISHLPAILDGSLTATPQDEQAATYCSLLKKSDCQLDWHKSAETLAREIRAYRAWPGSRTQLGSLEVIITGATTTEDMGITPGDYRATHDALYIGTADGNLSITHLKPLGKKEMPIRAFLAGYSRLLAQ